MTISIACPVRDVRGTRAAVRLWVLAPLGATFIVCRAAARVAR
jgi:hypothetical protein